MRPIFFDCLQDEQFALQDRFTVFSDHPFLALVILNFIDEIGAVLNLGIFERQRGAAVIEMVGPVDVGRSVVLV